MVILHLKSSINFTEHWSHIGVSMVELASTYFSLFAVYATFPVDCIHTFFLVGVLCSPQSDVWKKCKIQRFQFLSRMDHWTIYKIINFHLLMNARIFIMSPMKKWLFYACSDSALKRYLSESGECGLPTILCRFKLQLRIQCIPLSVRSLHGIASMQPLHYRNEFYWITFRLRNRRQWIVWKSILDPNIITLR